MVLEDMELMLNALSGNISALKSVNPERVYNSGQ